MHYIQYNLTAKLHPTECSFAVSYIFFLFYRCFQAFDHGVAEATGFHAVQAFYCEAAWGGHLVYLLLRMCAAGKQQAGSSLDCLRHNFFA